MSMALTPRPGRLKLVSPLVTGATSEVLGKDDHEWLGTQYTVAKAELASVKP